MRKAVSRRNKLRIKERGQARLPDLELTINDSENLACKPFTFAKERSTQQSRGQEGGLAPAL